MTLKVSQTDVQSGDYTVVISHGEVVHIGSSITGQSLSEGDTHNNSSRIVIESPTVKLSVLTIFVVRNIHGAYT